MNKNPVLKKLIIDLERQSRTQKVQIWQRIASDLAAPTRNLRNVNIKKIDNISDDNESVIVPGKVLGSGLMTHKVTVVAYQFSQSAIEKIKHAGGTARTIREELEKNPKGSKLRIVG